MKEEPPTPAYQLIDSPLPLEVVACDPAKSPANDAMMAMIVSMSASPPLGTKVTPGIRPNVLQGWLRSNAGLLAQLRSAGVGGLNPPQSVRFARGLTWVLSF